MDATQVIGPGLMYDMGTLGKHYPYLDNINILHKLGVRRLSPIVNYRNFIGDGCLERYDSGLSHFGLAFIERMNKVSILTYNVPLGREEQL